MTTANLTVADNEAVVQYVSTGESVFDIPFPFLANDEIRVSVDQADQVLATDYNLAGAGAPSGGQVTFTSATTAGERITIWLEMPIRRLTGFSTGAAVLTGEALNSELARVTRIDQMLRRDIGRGLRLPIDDAVAGIDMELPAVAARQGKYLRFADVNGAPEMAELVASGTTLSQSVIAGFLWPQTAGELAAGVTPTNVQYEPGDVRRYGVIGDGVTYDTVAIQAALDTGHRVKLIAGHTYRIDMGVGLTVPNGTVVSGLGAAFRFDNVTGTLAAPYLTFGNDVNWSQLDFTTPGTETDGNAILVGDRCHFGWIRARSDAQRATGNLFEVAGSGFQCALFDVEDQDRPLILTNTAASPWATATGYAVGDEVSAKNGHWTANTAHTSGATFTGDIANWTALPRESGHWIGHLRIRDYIRAFSAVNQDDVTIESFDIRSRSPNASNSPGHNGMLLNDVNNMKGGSGTIEDAGEHAIRVGGAGCIGVHFGTVQVDTAGGTALKLNPGSTESLAYDFTMAAIHGVDIGEGATGGNQEFLRLTRTRDCSIGIASCTTRDEAVSCQRALQLNDVDGLVIGELRVKDANGGLINFDETSDSGGGAGDVRRVYINVRGSCGGTHWLTFGMPNFNIGDIFITGVAEAFTTNILNFDASTTVDGPVVLTLVNAQTATGPSILNPPANDEVVIDLVDNQSRYLGRIDRVRVDAGNLQANGAAFNLADAVTDGALGTFYGTTPGATAGAGNYGASYMMGGPGSSRRRAGIAAKQITATLQQVGLAFLCANPGTSASDAVLERMLLKHDGTLKLPALSTFADDTAAGSGGLVAGELYQTATGELRIKT